jgi:hypothetical protein
MCFIAMVSMAVSSAMLIWAGTAMLAVGMNELSYITLGMAAIAAIIGSNIAPKTVADTLSE